MNYSLRTVARPLGLFLLLAGTAAAQVPPGNYWDTYPGRGPAWSAPSGGYSRPAGNSYSVMSQLPGPSQLNTPAPEPIPYPSTYAPVRPELPMSASMGPEFSGGAGDFGTVCNGWGRGSGQWLVGVDALMMTRLAGSSYPLITYPLASSPFDGPAVALDTGDMRYSWQFGYQLTASYMPACGWGVEAAFTGIADTWHSEACLADVLQFNGPGWTFGSNPDNPHDVYFQVRDESTFYSAQLNAVHGLCDWATLRVGARWVYFDDQLRICELYTPVYDLFSSHARNTAIGPQIGADLKLLELFCGRLRITGTANVGLLYNQISWEDPGLVGPWLHAKTNELSVLGEIGLMGKWRFTEHLALRGGYRVLGMNNVALAADQISNNDVTLGYGKLQTGSLVTHGASLGLEFFW